MDMWASLEHELRYKSERDFSEADAARLRLCSEAVSEVDREMQDIYLGNEPEYHAYIRTPGKCSAFRVFAYT